VTKANEAALSLGSNLGDREANLVDARRRISSVDGIEFLCSSPLYETEPVDVLPEYSSMKFLNAVVVVKTTLDAEDLMCVLEEIETDLGRGQGDGQNMPRLIDIDIIYIAGCSIRGKDLVVPHPRWFLRRFVVQPLSDVRPDMIVEGQDRKVSDILTTLPDGQNIILFKREW